MATSGVTTSAAPKNVLILGANSPLGVELIKGFLKLECQNVFATYRAKASAETLLQIAEEELRVKPIELDLRIPHFCKLHETIKSWIPDDGLNAIINVAGIFTEKQSICDLDQQEFIKFMQVNAISPLLVIQELLPLLVKASAKYEEAAETGLGRALIANVTSVASDSDGGGMYMTRSSRAALNAATKALAVDLQPKDIVAVGLRPNGVRREMNSEENAEDCYTSVEDSATGLLCVLCSLNMSHSGLCYDFQGKNVSW